MKRRELISATGASLVSASMIGATSGRATGQSTSSASIVFNDQSTDGRTVTVAKIETDVDARFVIRDTDSNGIAGPINFDAETAKEEYQVRLNQPLSETEQVSANLYNDDGQGIAREVATISVDESVDFLQGMEPTFVEADPAAGFHYPYYLYAPTRTDSEGTSSILIQPNNSGQTTDDFEVQKHSAKHRIEGGTSRTIADRLAVPLLIPVFPRPRSDPVDWRHYVHALDRQTMQISDGPLERVDLQLLRMVEDAQKRLKDQSYPVDDKVMLNGFSAAGNFVDRFTFLHPERVRSVTAGGLNGTCMLPLKETDGQRLDFHIGIADVPELTGEEVDLEALSETNQLLYMGEDDGNDTIPYGDAWSDDMRQIALDVYGEDMVADRFPTCQQAYKEAGVDAQFKVYRDTGHSPRPALDDIVEFHRRSLNNEGVSEFGEELGLQADFEYAPSEPAAGDEITFDGSSSDIGVGEILAYTWEIGDEETAADKTVSHRFGDDGDYAVTLRVVDSKGRTATTSRTVSVGTESETKETTSSSGTTQRTAPEGNITSANPTETKGESTASQSTTVTTTVEASRTKTTDGSAPGFGIGAAVTSVCGTLYAVSQRAKDSD